jgi:molybdopterin-guanine dinucleotide biosynthesis protein A
MGADKALLQFEGEPLVLRVARRLAVAAYPVLLAPGTAGRLGPLGFDEVEDLVQESGPLGGLVAGLAASPHPLLAVVAVDMPFVSPEVLLLLANELGDGDAAIPVTDRGLEPLHAVYSVRALAGLRSALESGQLGLQQAVSDRLRIRRVDEPDWRAADPSGTFAVNLNRPEDAARIAATVAWTASGPRSKQKEEER